MIRVSNAGRCKRFSLLQKSRSAVGRDYFPEIKLLGEDLKNMGVSHRTEKSEGQIFGSGEGSTKTVMPGEEEEEEEEGGGGGGGEVARA
jgi:hypothetical protein